MGTCALAAVAGDDFVIVYLTASQRTATIAGAVTADSITASGSSLPIAGIAAAQFDRRMRDALADPAHETATALRGADFTVNPDETLLQAARRTRALATGERRALR
jgi:hypothetical protein